MKELTEPKQVERITREDMTEALEVNMQDPKIFTKPLQERLNKMLLSVADYIEHLELEKGKMLASMLDMQCKIDELEACKKDWTWDEPKPVERITREEAISYYYTNDESDDVPMLNKIFDYIEHLEANQKGKQ